jgi:hypothetical protein
MHLVHIEADETHIGAIDEHRRSVTRRQQALLHSWLASGYLLAFCGLFFGLLISVGLDVGVGLALSLTILAPVVLSMISAAARRYRLASVLGFVSFLLCSLLTVAMLLGPLDGYPLLEQLARSSAGAVCAALAALTAISSWTATRALWGVPRSPRQLGPGDTLTSLAAGSAAGFERVDVAAPPPTGRCIQFVGA